MRETSYTDPFWSALEEGRFLIHGCDGCEEAFFPPSPICPHCHSTDVRWEEASGEGRIHTYTRQHTTAADFEDGIVVGVVELSEGPRLLARIDARYEALSIGDPVGLEARRYDQAFDRGRLADSPFYVATVRSE
ncbi:Zn-ribbon domain-containing OB-fold protein [Natronorarus salvus]|uniref:Zn-ribbon domain-containing OB-fold protein n=1 Tax=Natronorarus salvus TaxID=3117733 RepID=UPI002F26D019